MKHARALQRKNDLLTELRELQLQMAKTHKQTDARLKEIVAACKPKKSK